jgi:gag-polypeptide of LTR copia-type
MDKERTTRITKLAADGSNWVNYRDRMLLLIRSQKWKDHLTENSPTKRYIAAGNVDGATPNEQWEDDQAALINLIASSIPDSVFNKVKDKANTKGVWEALKDLHEERSPMVTIELQWCIGNVRCGDDENLRTHFVTIFGYGMVRTACLFMVHVSGLIDSFGTGSNVFDPCLFSYCLYLVFPFLSRQSSLKSPLVSSVLVFPFYGHFQRLLICTYVG